MLDYEPSDTLRKALNITSENSLSHTEEKWKQLGIKLSNVANITKITNN